MNKLSGTESASESSSAKAPGGDAPSAVPLRSPSPRFVPVGQAPPVQVFAVASPGARLNRRPSRRRRRFVFENAWEAPVLS